MLGIGKKKETEKTAVKGNEKEAENDIQFDFDENDKLPFNDEGFDEEYVEVDEASAGGMRQFLAQKKTLLLGLFLLLALGAAGYYFLNSTPAPPPKPAPSPKAKVKVKPAQPAPAPATAVKPAQPAPVPATAAKPASPAPVSAMAVQPAQPAPVPATAAKAASPVPVAATSTKDSKSAPAVKASTAPVATTVPAAKVPATTATVAPVPEVGKVASVAVAKPYSISVGAFLTKEHQLAAEKKIRKLGYTPKVETTYSMVPMTRLLLGIYNDPTAAETRRRELVGIFPDVFVLKQGTDVALYAGSYQSLDEARRYADKLFRLGILVDEENVSLRMPLKKVSFGPFASKAAAEKAAKRAVAAGLPAQIVKR